MKKYPPQIEDRMKNFYASLNERDKRRYAAIEAKKLGYGGIVYITRVLNCNFRTIKLGMKELDASNEMQNNRIRRPGGGKKRYLDTIKNIDDVFLEVLKDHTAGDPMNKNIYWTNLTQKEISNRMKKKSVNISVVVVKQLLKKHGYVKRKAQKKNL